MITLINLIFQITKITFEKCRGNHKQVHRLAIKVICNVATKYHEKIFAVLSMEYKNKPKTKSF